jgi:thiamine pyrophosphate-dependent acetolactate synthase large subunit-like protein
MWGAMGGPTMIGLGLALARPDRRVAVITGDGDLLMGLGSLATIGVPQPRNLSVLVLDNRRYGETGMQASHTDAGLDQVKIAEGCRFKIAYATDDTAETEHLRTLLHGGEGPIFVQARITPDDVARVLPTSDGHAIKFRFMQALGSAPT